MILTHFPSAILCSSSASPLKSSPSPWMVTSGWNDGYSLGSLLIVNMPNPFETDSSLLNVNSTSISYSGHCKYYSNYMLMHYIIPF